MTTRSRRRRLARRYLATFAVLALLGVGCGNDDAPATEPTGTGIPETHGLSDAMLARVLASTVGIEGVACGVLASGSGFALTEDLVVTNAHVILGIDEIRIHTLDGRELAATPVAFEPDDDLALLDVEGGGFAPLPLTDTAPTGSTGVLVGWESGRAANPTPYRVDRAVTVRIETVGGTERVERPAWLIAADIDVGDSGAALIDRTGEVIGVAFATSTVGEGVGYAVRSSAIDDLVAAGTDPNLTIPGC